MKKWSTFLVIILVAIHQPSLKAEEKIPEREPRSPVVQERDESDKIVITAEDIKRMNVRTVTELLNQIPGVRAGESSVNLRGTYKVRVLLDGRSINDPLFRHGELNGI